VRDKWINVTVRGTGCVWSYFIFIYPFGFSDENFENSFIVITECGVDQPRLSHWHWSDLGAILAQDLISDLFWELSRPPLAPWWFIIYHCEGRRCLLRSFLFHWCAVICSGESRSDFTWAQFIFWHYLLSEVITSSQIEVILCEVLFICADGVDSLLGCTCDGSDRDHSVVRFYLFVLKELIYSLFAFVMFVFLFIWGRSPSIDLMGWSTHLHPQSPTSPEDEKFA
jgi:hypothetical protein